MGKKVDNSPEVIDTLKKRLADAIATGNGSLAKAILMRINYLESLDDPSDVQRLAKTSPEFRKDVGALTKYTNYETEAQQALDKDMPARPLRDEKTAKKTLTIEELGKIAANTDGVGDIFDDESDYSWKKWTPTQLNAYSKEAGMSRGDFMKKVGEFDAAKQRESIVNDGIGGLLMDIFTPRRKQDILEGNDPSIGSTVLDIGENVAQALPIGKFLNMGGKVVRVVSPAVKKVVENAAVPSLFAYIDAARAGDVSEGANKALEGTAVNFATPRVLNRVISKTKGAVGDVGKKAVKETTKKAGGKVQQALKKVDSKIDKYLAPLAGEPAQNYATNKLGKQQYGNRALDFIANVDPTGNVGNFLEYLPGSEADKAQKEREKQKKLEKKHQKDLADQYKALFSLEQYL